MANEKLLKEVGTRICLRRKELQMTQEQLSERMDVSVQMISNLELGKKAIRPENLVKLCEVLSVSADYILRGGRSDAEIADFAEKYSRLSSEDQALIDRALERLLRN